MAHALRTLVLAACAPLLLAGCTDSSPTAVLVRGGGAPSLQAGPPAHAGLARFLARPSVGTSVAMAKFGPAGGRLEHGGFVIEVPAGAVDRVTQFSIRLPAEPSGDDRVIADFGPNHTGFAVPVTIELPYAGTDAFGEEASIVRVTPQGEWEALPTTVTADGQRLRATTTHLSEYGSMRSGGLLASGG